MKSTTLAIAAIASAWPLLGRAQPLERRVDANPRGMLEVVNPDGEISIEAWDRNEVRVTGELSQSAERLDVRADGDRVIVEVFSNRDDDGSCFFGFCRGSRSDGGTDLVIRAPATMALDVRARAADIDVTAMRGEQRISGVSGDIRTEAFDEELQLETVSGDIRIEGHDGVAVIRASAVSGDVRISAMAGEVWADSVSGDVTVIGGAIERAELKSVSGDIRIMAAISAAARLDAMTTSGDVDMDFRGAADGEYRLETFSGTINACFGATRDPDVVRRSRFGPGDELRFTEGRSNARIEARTHSGDIRVCRE